MPNLKKKKSFKMKGNLFVADLFLFSYLFADQCSTTSSVYFSVI